MNRHSLSQTSYLTTPYNKQPSFQNYRHSKEGGTPMATVLLIRKVVDSPWKCILEIIQNVSRFNYMLYIVYIISLDTVRYGEDSSSSNKLMINKDKTVNLLFSHCHAPTERTTVKLLGFHLDGGLRWNSHIQEVCTELSIVLYILRKLRPIIALETLRNIYFALFQSHLNYGIQFWGGATAIVVFSCSRRKPFDAWSEREARITTDLYSASWG